MANEENMNSIDYKLKYEMLKSKLERFILAEEKFIVDKSMDYLLSQLGKIINEN